MSELTNSRKEDGLIVVSSAKNTFNHVEFSSDVSYTRRLLQLQESHRFLD